MKKRLLITLMLFLSLSACASSSNGDAPSNGKQIPTFTGLSQMVEGSDEGRSKINPRRANEEYSVPIGSDVYLTAHFSNPDAFEILSFTINETKFTSYMFLPGSNLTDISVSLSGSNTVGDYVYKISQIKYVDGTEIKNVKMSGNDSYTVHFYDSNDISRNKLTIFTSGLAFTNLLEREINKLIADNNIDIKCDVINSGSYDDILQRIKLGYPAGTFECALFLNFPNHLDEIDKMGIQVMDLSKLVSSNSLNSINSDILGAYKKDNQLRGLPLYFGTDVTVYNKEELSTIYGSSFDEKTANFDSFEYLFNEVSKNSSLKFGMYSLTDLVLDWFGAYNKDFEVNKNQDNINNLISMLETWDGYLSSNVYVREYRSYVSFDNGDVNIYNQPIGGLNHNNDYDLIVSRFNSKVYAYPTGISYIRTNSKANTTAIDQFVGKLCDEVLLKNEFINEATNGVYLPVKNDILNASAESLKTTYKPNVIKVIESLHDNNGNLCNFFVCKEGLQRTKAVTFVEGLDRIKNNHYSYSQAADYVINNLIAQTL